MSGWIEMATINSETWLLVALIALIFFHIFGHLLFHLIGRHGKHAQ